MSLARQPFTPSPPPQRDAIHTRTSYSGWAKIEEGLLDHSRTRLISSAVRAHQARPATAFPRGRHRARPTADLQHPARVSPDSVMTSGPGRMIRGDRTQQPTRPAHAATVVELDYHGGRRWWCPPSRRWSGSCCCVTMVGSKHKIQLDAIRNDNYR